MSNFEIKYLKEVLANLKIIISDMDYGYKMENVIEDLEELIKAYGG